MEREWANEDEKDQWLQARRDRWADGGQSSSEEGKGPARRPEGKGQKGKKGKGEGKKGPERRSDTEEKGQKGKGKGKKGPEKRPATEEKGKKGKGKGKQGSERRPEAEEKGKGGQEEKGKKGPERRPVFEPEHWEGRPEWDPFWQEGRGKRSREARKAERSQRPDVQERRERGLQEGYPPNQVQPLQPGSQKWRLIKERERDLAKVEREVLADRARLAEERQPSWNCSKSSLRKGLGGLKEGHSQLWF